MSQTKTIQTWSLASIALHDTYTDFILSWQAINAKKITLDFYYCAVGKFSEWIEQRGITSPGEITSRYIRESWPNQQAKEIRYNRREQTSRTPSPASDNVSGAAG